MYNKIKSVWTKEKIKSECISIAYDYDLYDLFYTPCSRGGIYHQSICDVIKQQVYNYCSAAELKAQIADKCDAIYDEELDIIIPKSIPTKEYKNICNVYSTSYSLKKKHNRKMFSHFCGCTGIYVPIFSLFNNNYMLLEMSSHTFIASITALLNPHSFLCIPADRLHWLGRLPPCHRYFP